jgi:opacity protein-like surface antigen
MKKILLATAALAVIASPALAQNGARKVVPNFGPAAIWQGSPLGAYAQNPAFAASRRDLGGDYVGIDPDPSVQLQLLKDAQSRE